jgi:anthranilate synthase component 1
MLSNDIDYSKLNFSAQQFEENISKHSATILFKNISADILTPVLAYLKISKIFPTHNFIFESAENANNKGRYSVIGFNPDKIWRCFHNQSHLNENFAKNPNNFILQKNNSLDNLRQFINTAKIEWSHLKINGNNIPPLCSGVFGYMGYDIVKLMENLPDKHLKDELKIPDSTFIRPQILIVFDNLFDTALICAPRYLDSSSTYQQLAKFIDDTHKILIADLPNKQNTNNSFNFNNNFTSNFTEQQYCNAVKKSQQYIIAGDIFQVLPSQRFMADFPAGLDPFYFYRSLRSINPSPFLFYIKFDDFVISGSSPEIMVSLKGSLATIRPLAGTRKRGSSPQEDKIIADNLLSDEKEIAEHLMLIDLGRHDLGIISKPQSVKVSKKMVVEYYSHVMHLSSTVEGEIKPELEALDALIAGFPAGTVSGAPKIRAMEIIEEIEHEKRSFYAGCLGYFASNGDMETCITIRSALIKNNKIYLQAGAGVVFDSIPVNEYQECINKAQALVRAFENIKNII